MDETEKRLNNPLHLKSPLDKVEHFIRESASDAIRFFSRLNVGAQIAQTVTSARDYCAAIDCLRSGWGGFYKDGRFWLASAQTVIGWGLPAVAGFGGAMFGGASMAGLGAVVGTVAPVAGNIIGGAGGLAVGVVVGGGAGAALGSIHAESANTWLRRRWRENGWMD